MSKRRQANELVWKLPNAGFAGLPGLGKLVEGTDDLSFMCECGDEECREWDMEMEGGGYCPHVAECQMADKNPDQEIGTPNNPN